MPGSKLPGPDTRLPYYRVARAHLDRCAIQGVRWAALQTAQRLQAAPMTDALIETVSDVAEIQEVECADVLMYLAQIGSLTLWLETGTEQPEDWPIAERQMVKRLLEG